MDIAAVGRQFGLDEAQTRAALDALVPVVAAGVRKTAQSPDGFQEIVRSVLTGGYGNALDDDEAVTFDRAKPAGDQVLGQIFGEKEVSREVAQQLSATSGVGAAILKKLLPIVATMVLGTLAKKMGSGGAVAGERAPPASPGGGFGDILRDVLGGGQAAPEQVPQRQAQRPMRAPGSEQGGSLEDILGDILGRRGGGDDPGRVVVEQVPPDQMGEILRDILGGGFPGSGGSDEIPQRRSSEEAVTRGRRTLDDMLGGGTGSGNAADDLLNSVERALRRR